VETVRPRLDATPGAILSDEYPLRGDTVTAAATTPKRGKMPETAHHMNGYANGHAPPELQQDTAFLFTSESARDTQIKCVIK